jgi:hypothetical protein
MSVVPVHYDRSKGQFWERSLASSTGTLHVAIVIVHAALPAVFSKFIAGAVNVACPADVMFESQFTPCCQH